MAAAAAVAVMESSLSDNILFHFSSSNPLSHSHQTSFLSLPYHFTRIVLTETAVDGRLRSSISTTPIPDSVPKKNGPVISIPDSTIKSSVGSGGNRDRRRAVRIAWEKLVRWSRSWRSKNKTDVLEKTSKVVVLGGGSFGTAMAAHVASKKADIQVCMLLRDENVCRSINHNHLNCKYFPNNKLPENVIATINANDALAGADFCLHAVPVQFSSSFLKGISSHVDPNLPFISLSKGLELNTLKMMSQIIPQALGNSRQPFVVLSGPSFAIAYVRSLSPKILLPGGFHPKGLNQIRPKGEGVRKTIKFRSGCRRYCLRPDLVI